ncbi:hypothetical protein DFP72DRAFT_545156 [Ephemerocybe angulata]|uniref:Thioredoxin-like protein AAED1 n=1 Tax=Ephemerocybe angulata TaxID=980116 RepID=A0A8H6HP88_9AGAR|nr:hypothetical protein DFP72DRAFT_545156 [Tulosesus angulatus]
MSNRPNSNTGTVLNDSSDAKALPNAETISAAGELEIYDSGGEKVQFKSLFSDQEVQTVIVVFIRHFFCGACHAYVESLASTSQASLDASNTRIVIIGCGAYEGIVPYRERTLSQSPIASLISIYADPDRKLFHALGMTYLNIDRPPADQPTPAYLGGMSIIRRSLASIYRAITNPSMIGWQGNIFQNGGEFVFGPGMNCRFASRMRNPEDHVPVEELMKAAGVGQGE